MKESLNVNLTNKVVVITGAGGAICSGLSRACAQAGAKVALLDLRREAAENVAAELRSEGLIAQAYEANVLEKESLTEAHRQVLHDLGKCDVLINGAGGNNPRATTDNEFHFEAVKGCKTFFDLDPEGVSFIFDLNFMGVLLPTQVFAGDMEGRAGCILNISSMNAFTPLTKIPAYSGAKAAVSNFTQWLATYFAKSGIRVNAIAPGFFVGEQNRALLFNPDGTPSPRTAKILSHTPMGRFGNLDELVGPALFLLDEHAAGFVTGVVLPVDGGFSAYSGV